MTIRKAIRMTRCFYTVRGESEWVPMRRSRKRCPRCGADVKTSGSDSAHRVVVRVPDEAVTS